ncbi:YeeE/YedE family protein [Reinekea sp. G2M2-21]|uniref:YeeE/YedE family protein n=1 Tax=Reinekea sp. G2M2-21 TaxID=2788942 RepID=UPI0018AC694B|nr:YeeE/YedE thiosulfate transporter family protein [Reinekea sp. G2M2-21]
MEIVNFTPIAATVGGALIGLSAALLLLVKGRIAGVSGIAGGIIYPELGDIAWRTMFVLGLVLGGFAYQWLSGDSTDGLFMGIDHIQSVSTTPVLIIAGLLVGVGTTIGTGCTSGHGICGLARRSPRSLAATLSFMASGALTVFIVRQLIGA